MEPQKYKHETRKLLISAVIITASSVLDVPRYGLGE